MSKCATKLLLFQQNEDTFANDFIKEILLLKLDMEKEWKNISVLSDQNEEYEHLETSVSHQIDTTKQNIIKLSDELDQEKTIGHHRFESNDLAVVVNKHPSKSSLKRKLNLITEISTNTEQLIQSTNFEISHRFEQCKVLGSSILSLQAAVVDESNAPVTDLVDTEDPLDENQFKDSDRDNRVDYSSSDHDAAFLTTKFSDDDNLIEEEEEEMLTEELNQE